MSAPAFSQTVKLDVLRVLHEAGWFEGRTIDIRGLSQAHERRGLTLFPLARSFAESFGELALSNHKLQPWASFHGERTLSGLSDAQLEAMRNWLGEPFSVLGFLSSGDKQLVMSERGAFYGAGEHVLVCYGTDLAEMFERICHLRQAQERTLN